MSVVVRVAMPVWAGRISPVFDVARHVLVVDFEGTGQVGRQERLLEETDLAGRVRRLTEWKPDVLICGAISQPLEAMVTAAGIQLIPQTCGEAEDVLAAFASGQMGPEAFLMPGSGGRRHRVGAGRQRPRRRMGL